MEKWPSQCVNPRIEDGLRSVVDFYPLKQAWDETLQFL